MMFMMKQTHKMLIINCFYDKLFNIYDRNIPLKESKHNTKFHNQKTPWITKGILKARKTKNKLYQKFIKNPNQRNELEYKRFRNKFNKIKQAAKRNHYNKEFIEHKGNLKCSWKLIKEVLNKNNFKMELPDNIKENESLITNKIQISNKFNEYFVNVGPNLANKIKDNNVNFKTF